MGEPVQPVGGLLRDEGGRQREVGELRYRLDDLAAQQLAGLEALGAADALAHVGAQLGDRVELAGGQREVVVELRQLLGLDLLDDHGEVGLLAGDPVGEVRAQDVAELQDLAGAGALQLAVQLCVGLGRGHLVEQVLAAGLVDDLLAAPGGDRDHHEVSGLHGPLHGLQLREALLQLGELQVELLVGDLPLWVGDLQALVRGDLEVGAHVDRGVDDGLAALLERLDLELRAADDRDVRVAYGLLIEAGQRGAQGLLLQRLGADARLQHLARHAALAEPGDLDLPGQRGRGGVDGAGDALRLDGERELDAGLVELLDGGLQGRCLRGRGGSNARGGSTG